MTQKTLCCFSAFVYLFGILGRLSKKLRKNIRCCKVVGWSAGRRGLGDAPCWAQLACASGTRVYNVFLCIFICNSFFQKIRKTHGFIRCLGFEGDSCWRCFLDTILVGDVKNHRVWDTLFVDGTLGGVL